MNDTQLKTIVGRKIIKIEIVPPSAEKRDTCKLSLDDGRAVEVLFFEKHGGTVKVVER